MRTNNSDPAHAETDALLADLEDKIAKEYRQAVVDTQAKLDGYLRRFEIKDEKWRLMVANGEKTEAEYKAWRQGQIMIGKRWEEMRDILAQDYHNANVIARSMVNGYMPEVYALNHNYATFEVEKGALVDTSYTLYDRQTVERLMRDNPDLLPPPGKNMKARIAAGKDIRWQEGQIQSVTLQSILQGESIPNMSKRIAREMGEKNHASTIRYARTAVTGAQNAGRMDAYKRTESLGIEMEVEWLATLDNRTRHSHRQLDGMRTKVGVPFEFDDEAVGHVKIGYPGDLGGEEYKVPQSLVWNCRCRIVAAVKGWEDKVGALRSNKAIDGQPYEEWKQGHSQPERITKQEETGEAIKQSYISEYKRAGSTKSVETGRDSAIIGAERNSGGSDVKTVGKIDREIYKCVTPDIWTDEVVLTDERIEHIKEHHPNDYERFVGYIPRIIAEPDYIIEANKPNTAAILKEIEENGEKFKLILRMKVENDPAEYKNSVLSFWHIGETTWDKTTKNKKILYKRE